VGGHGLSNGSFDVVIAGGGSAGCALARRLVERSDLRVCLLEAGPDYGSLADGRWPSDLLDPATMPRTHDWGYLETRGDELRPESRAKVIGGCSSHNQCAAVWGQPEDYDGWGVDGWRSTDLDPVKRDVDLLVAAKPAAELSSWQRNWVEAALSAGYARLDDVGEPGGHVGAAPFHANVRHGVRWNAAFAFLDDVRNRSNVVVMGDTVVESIDDARQVTLRCRSDRETFTLTARRCVLCAGAYGSPSILLRSGIGSGVGANLHDHCGVRVRFRPTAAALRQLEEDFGSGRFAQSQVMIRARSSQAGAFDVHLVPYQTQTDDGDWTFQVLAFLLAPKSRGRFSLDDGVPRIDFGFLDEHGDVARLRDALGAVRDLAQIEPLAGAVDDELEPTSTGVSAGTVIGYAHAVGTCALGGVVDETCRVREAENVYVADASIIPTIPRGNPNLTCFAIGLRAADLLLEAR
jgi:choline dehydrogenase